MGVVSGRLGLTAQDGAEPEPRQVKAAGSTAGKA